MAGHRPPPLLMPSGQYHPLRVLKPDECTSFHGSLSIFLCKECVENTKYRTTVELPQMKQMVSFVICHKCMETNRQIHFLVGNLQKSFTP